MRLVGPTHYADLRGPTACELITDAEAAAIRARLGEDPLRRDADPDRAWARISRSRAPLATLLMDQTVIAGVGNVYRAEVLFRHGLDPQLPGRGLGRERWDAMWADLVGLLRDGGAPRPDRDAARPSTTRGRSGRPAGSGARGEVYVYRRTGEPCLVCGTPIAHDDAPGPQPVLVPDLPARRGVAVDLIAHTHRRVVRAHVPRWVPARDGVRELKSPPPPPVPPPPPKSPPPPQSPPP